MTEGAEDARVHSAMSKALVGIPALAGAWARWQEAVVDVASRPRATRTAKQCFEPDSILMDHAGSTRGSLSLGFMETLPRQLVRLGFAASLLMLVMDCWLADWSFVVDGPDRWAPFKAILAGLWLTPLPLFFGLVLAAWVRFFSEWMRQAYRVGLLGLVGWLDSRYRMVSQEELLARVLAAVERLASKENA